jgi:hypothetical protein
VRRLVCFRRVALRVEVQRDLALIGFRFADRVIVHVEADPGARLHEPAGAFGEDVGVLADGVLDEKLLAAGTAVPSRQRHVVVVVLHERADQMVCHLLVADARLGFDCSEPAIFRETGIDEIVAPPVRALCRHLVPHGGDDEVWRAEAPGVVVLELHGRRHVGRVALRRARIHPFHDRRDLSSVSDGSSLNLVMPTPRATCTAAYSALRPHA